MAGEAASLADSLRDTVGHVESAARAVKEGKLEQVLAEARRKLEQDLDKLRGVHEGAHAAPAEWREARRTEHAALTEEVREKLEKVERIRRALGLLLPHLQAITRTLAAVQKVQALVRRLEPEPAAGVEAARMSLLLGSAACGRACSSTHRGRAPGGPRCVRAGSSRRPPRSSPSCSRSCSRAAASKAAPVVTTTTAATTTSAADDHPAPVPKAPALSPVKAVFSEAQRATFYTIAVAAPGQSATVTWRLTPPAGNPTCDKFHPVAGKPNEAVWHHADTDGCTHNGIQHLGTVHVTVTTSAWQCTASFFGTLTQTGASNQRCTRR